MIRLIPLLVLLLTNTVMFLAEPVQAGEQQKQVGIVKDLGDSPEYYRLVRIEDGQRMVHSVGPSTILYEDDVLWLGCRKPGFLKPGEDKVRITIELTDKERKLDILTCHDSPYMLGKGLPRVEDRSISEPAIQDRVRVGYVKELSAPSDLYLLVRRLDGKEVACRVDIYTWLYEGDVIWVGCGHGSTLNGDNKEKISVVLGLADGEKRLECGDAPYLLRKIKPNSLFDNICANLSNVFKCYWPPGLHDDYHHAKLVSLAVRGTCSRLFMPLAARSGSRLVAGTRDLYLAWYGGNPPYGMQIRTATSPRPIVERTGLDVPRIRVDGLSLEPGDYDIEVTDADNKSIIRSCKVVPRVALPTSPAEAFIGEKGGTDRLLCDTIYAAWLSQQDDGAWMLEAYQHVADIASEYYPAELLRVQFEGEL
ncbi:MAG: hypothetical protein KKC76_20955 [Proteobacteria bacterium]|nr:hypothetical protein [Pseudomonadota bacterium]MBU4298143.1 hypothetical protein [Pseudomonadota bacterium]MCG2749517.1 hypothetical protein [Desulfobulbaceae bacterium]